jgi:biotin carboxyl carrier protein
MIQLTINGANIYKITRENNKYVINGMEIDCRIEKISHSAYQIIINNRAFLAHLTQSGGIKEIQIGHHKFSVSPTWENGALEGMPEFKRRPAKKLNELRSPMPGFIADILVSKGDHIKTGQPLVILKAMKMENIIKAPHDGEITEIFIIKNQKIEKDAVMFQF